MTAPDRNPDLPVLRSQLYVPGNRSDWFEGALDCGADALIIDLEDAVPPALLIQARTEVSEFLRAHRDGLPLFVRVVAPGEPEFLDHVTMAVRAGAFGIVVPKVRAPGDVQLTARLLDWLEARSRSSHRTVVVPLLETAGAIADARAIGESSERIAYMGGIATKGGDVQREIGYRWSPEGWETLVLRACALIAMRAAGVPHPVTGLWTDIEDLDGLRAFAAQGRNLGYEGMAVIHPSHVPIVNMVFDVPPEELERYRNLIETVARAEARGSSAIRFDGHMVDRAMVNTALAELARAGHPRQGRPGEAGRRWEKSD